MRNIQILIQPRVDNDYSYYFNSNDEFSSDSIYSFINMKLNYSLQTSNILSDLTLSMNEPLNSTNQIKSGQNIIVNDNGKTIFQGIVLSIRYKMLPVSQNGGGNFAFLILAPSIYQLCMLPMVYSEEQKQQINNLLKINVEILLIAGITQKVKTQDLFNYVISNTDITNIFNHTININDLPNEVYILSEAGQNRDAVIRSSLDYTNTVFYQQEDGQIIIRQLSTENIYQATFGIALNLKDRELLNLTEDIQYPTILSYDFVDNALVTPTLINSYCILPTNLSVAVNNNFVSVMPNSEYYPRVHELLNNGWYSARLTYASINDNIIKDTGFSAILNNYKTNSSKYLINSNTTNALNESYNAFQTLLINKEMAQGLINYNLLEVIMSLDDEVFDNMDTSSLLGKIVNINNSSINNTMKSGIITTYSRDYSLNGSFINLSIAPEGSITGYWKS